MTRPLCIELFCGCFGWSAGWLDLGGYAVGFDLEHLPHHGPVPKGADMVIQDVLTLHGRQFRDASIILASPPCQFFSYCAMPWGKAKQLARDVRADPERTRKETALFDACFRIQREAIEAAGHFIPLIVENVRGANEWVGRSRWNFGSFHLWGDVPALMPVALNASKVPGFLFDGNGGSFQTASVAQTGIKAPGMDWSNPEKRGQDFTRLAGQHATKNTGGSWFNIPGPGGKVANNNPVHAGVKGFKDFHDSPISALGSKSKARNARKAASAAIAKIPFPLSSHIARTYYPRAL